MGIVHAIVQAILFQPPKPTYDDHSQIIWLRNSLGERIPAIYVPHPRAKWTIIFSHANSEDLGYVHEWASELCYHVGVNVMIYDYTGYGLSSGEPSEEACYADIEAVWEFLTNRLGTPPSRIVAYGRSLGSGPSTELALRKPVCAVILQSAFVSIYRVALGTESRSLSGDMFCNLEKIRQLPCPVFVIHGTRDQALNQLQLTPFMTLLIILQLVSLAHGEALYNASLERTVNVRHKHIDPLWIQEGGHNNLEIYWKNTLTRRLLSFFDTLEKNFVENTDNNEKRCSTQNEDEAEKVHSHHNTSTSSHERDEQIVNAHVASRRQEELRQSIHPDESDRKTDESPACTNQRMASTETQHDESRVRKEKCIAREISYS